MCTGKNFFAKPVCEKRGGNARNHPETRFYRTEMPLNRTEMDLYHTEFQKTARK